MFKSKTYFEQVPLEFVRRMVEEQIQEEATSETFPGVEKEMLSEVLSEAEGESILQTSKLAQVETLN